MEISDTAIVGVIMALIGIISTMIALFNKMWNSHTELSKSVLAVVEKNTVATQQQINSTDKLSRAVDKNTEATQKQKDVLTKLAMDALKLNKRGDDL